MLYSYWQQQKAKGDPVQALFFVGGVDSADPTLRRFVLVPEAELASAKAKFSQVTSCHVYSLQRALPKVQRENYRCWDHSLN